MQAIFQLQHTSGCHVTIAGMERPCNTYDGIFTYDGTVSVNVIHSVDITEEKEEKYDLYTYDINDHSSDDVSDFHIEEDGLYMVSHYILPKKDSLEYIDELAKKKFVFAYDGEHIVKYWNGQWDIVQINDFISLNINNNFTVALSQDYMFSMCGLKECFFNINREILGKFCGADRCNTQKHKDLVYKRDLLWMAINVIDYLLDEDRYFEALNIMRELIGCTGFCKDNSKYGSDGCGCRA